MRGALILLVVAGLYGPIVEAQPTHLPVRHHRWNRAPIPIVLPVGIEKRIEFPGGLRTFKVPAALQAPASRLQWTPDGRVYWLANAPWPLTRVLVVGNDGYTYPLDVSASADGEANPLIIDRAPAADAEPSQADERAAPPNPAEAHSYVDLVRYAAQHLHGPTRLIKPLAGLNRIPLRRTPLPLVRGRTLEATPIAQWKSTLPVLYVTAVGVRNRMTYPMELSPLALRGRWLFAAPHHARVSPRGTPGARSVWYLVSAEPFSAALPVSAQPGDAPSAAPASRETEAP